MTNPKNWPNPERPGVPMFPERDGWHITRCNLSPNGDYFRYWHSKEELWSETRRRNLCRLLALPKYGHDPDYVACHHEYIGPALTPKQIAELLSGEREQCLTIAIDEQWNFPSNPINQTKEAAVAFKACERIIEKIRNLGVVP